MRRWRCIVGIVAASLLVGSACDEPAAPAPSVVAPTEVRSTPPSLTPPPASPTTTLAPKPLSEGCPVESSVCNFAAEIDRLVQARDAASIVGRSRPHQFNCPTPGGEFDLPLCRGADPGDARSGYALAYLQSEGGLVGEAELRKMLGDWLAEAPFGWNLAAVGCGLTNPMVLTCSERFGVVFTEDSGSLMEFIVEQKPEPAIELFVHGIVSINQELAGGGHSSLPLRFNFEDRNGTDYFVVSSAPPR